MVHSHSLFSRKYKGKQEKALFSGGIFDLGRWTSLYCSASPFAFATSASRFLAR